MKLYHGTSESRARRIMAEGLKPRGKTGRTNWTHTIESNPKAVYLTDAYPIYFAFNACHDERWAILEIDTDKLDESRLHPDEDVLEQAGRNYDHLQGKGMIERTRYYRRARTNPNWEKSLEFMGTCGYYGEIPPEAITRVVLIDPEKLDGGFVLSMIDCSISLMNYKFCKEKYRNYTRWAMGAEVTPEDLGYFLPEAIEAVRPILKERAAFEELDLSSLLSYTCVG